MTKIKSKMQTRRATYAIDGLTEYVLRLPIGATYYDFQFTDGMLSGYGIRPATLTLSDPIAMRSLEASRQYRNGLIRKLDS